MSTPAPTNLRTESPASPPRWLRRLAYEVARFPVVLFFLVLYGVRFWGRENVPKSGPMLVVSNHQSHFDPPLIAAAILNRPLNFLARKTLFRFKPFAWLINLLDAIPLDQEGIGYAGIKESLRRLKRGEALLIFPEGSRTFTGEIGAFKSGFLTLAVRSRATILPTAIAGCFEAWPRTQRLPHLHGSIRVALGTPIPYEEYVSLTETELHSRVESQIRELYAALQLQHAAHGEAEFVPCGETDSLRKNPLR
ncbi:MAG: lysophospholipid acyltransferase family protein [Thermoguttaceae bacterium]